MLDTLFGGEPQLGLYLLQVAVALLFLSNGIPKLVHVKKYAEMLKAPAIMPFGIGLIEVIASLALVFNVQVSIASLSLAIIMLGAILMKVMKWKAPFNSMMKPGWDLDFILLFAAIALMLTGGSTLF